MRIGLATLPRAYQIIRACESFVTNRTGDAICRWPGTAERSREHRQDVGKGHQAPVGGIEAEQAGGLDVNPFHSQPHFGQAIPSWAPKPARPHLWKTSASECGLSLSLSLSLFW